MDKFAQKFFIRKPEIKDTPSIYSLISYYARRKQMLARSLNEIYGHLRDFWVAEYKKKIIGCCSLQVIGWQNLGEIRSLAVNRNYRRRGVGKALIEVCLQEAKTLGVSRVFVLTFLPEIFKRLGFKIISKKKLPHKIWKDCLDCPFFPDCKEVALVKDIKKRRS